MAMSIGRLAAMLLLLSGPAWAQTNNFPPIFSATAQGLAPLSGGGASNFLRADGTWNSPGGGGLTCAGCSTNVLPKTTGAGTLGDSAIGDDGTTVTITAEGFVVGAPTGGTQGAGTINAEVYYGIGMSSLNPDPVNGNADSITLATGSGGATTGDAGPLTLLGGSSPHGHGADIFLTAGGTTDGTTGHIYFTNQSGSSDIPLGGLDTKAITTDYTWSKDDSSTTITNFGAGGTVIVTLPDVIGTPKFCVEAAHTLEILTSGGAVQIYLGATPTTTNNITSTVVGSCVSLQFLDSSNWFAASFTGTWVTH